MIAKSMKAFLDVYQGKRYAVVGSGSCAEKIIVFLEKSNVSPPDGIYDDQNIGKNIGLLIVQPIDDIEDVDVILLATYEFKNELNQKINNISSGKIVVALSDYDKCKGKSQHTEPTLLNDLMNKFENSNGVQDINSFPNGFHLFDLSEKEYFKNIRKKILSYFPEKASYHFPKMLPNLKGYVTHTSPFKLDEIIDFSSIYYIDDPINKFQELSDFLEDKEIFNCVSSYYKDNFNSSFGVYHTSIYRTFKTADEESGYMKWHRDSFPKYIKKLLVYLDDIVCIADGPVQIRHDDGRVESIFGKAGTAIFFDMNFEHRGCKILPSSNNNHRNVMYFSFCPYDLDYVVPIQALGVDVIYPSDLNNAFVSGIKKQHAYPIELKKIRDVNGLNIGGGEFSNKGWLNFDVRYSNYSPDQLSFDLTKKLRFPLECASIEYIYTSHCIEHLKDDVVDYIFHESSRVLKKGGKMLIKIPDFEGVVNAYLNRDYAFFAGNWGIEKLENLMSNHNVNINLTTYMLLIFAGYKEYGATTIYENEPMSGKFFGPPSISKEDVDDALKKMSIKDFSRYLVSKIPKDAHDVTHINAFTNDELTKRASKVELDYVIHSFQNSRLEEYDEFKRCIGADEINSMEGISHFLLLEKK